MSIQRGSNQSGPRLDEERQREVGGLVSGGHESHAQEWKESEPAGEDQPEADRAPGTDLSGQAPPGMSPQDVAVRSDLARHLGRDAFPAGKDTLIERLREHGATDRLVGAVATLPPGIEYQNVQEVVAALGLGTEDQRF